MAEGGGGGGGGGLDPSKLAQCYAKLFQRQQAFAAEQAQVFSKLAAGDEATMTAVLKLQVGKVGGGGDDADKNAKGRKRKNMKKDPDMPKRPKNGYQFFVSERTPMLRAAQPEAKMTDLMSVLANEWKQLTDADKEVRACVNLGEATRSRFPPPTLSHAPPLSPPVCVDQQKYQKQAVTAKSAYQDRMATYKAGQGEAENGGGGVGGGGGGGGGGATPAKAAVPKAETPKVAAAPPAKEAEDDDDDDEHDANTESDTASEEVKKAKKKKKKHKHKHQKEES